MEPFKNHINKRVIKDIATHVGSNWTDFPSRAFTAMATNGLDELELKQRVAHVAQALAAHLPEDFGHACRVLKGALAPVGPTTSLSELGTNSEGLAGWAIWPLTTYVESYGQDDIPTALDALHAMTQRSTAEFALRPLLVKDADTVMRTLQRWLDDESMHVRRLVSEGTRPRLPWGIRLHDSVADPSRGIKLLDRLFRDPELYVRHSVANHLNDISKDHPDIAIETAKRWLKKDDSANTQRIVRHGLRTLIKAGHPGALALTGFDHDAPVSITFQNLPRKRYSEAQSLPLKATLKNDGDSKIRVSVDYAIHYLRANGTLSPKIFKWAKCSLEPGESLTLEKQHSLAAVTTRRHYAGEHRVDVRINGVAHGEQAFSLQA